MSNRAKQAQKLVKTIEAATQDLQKLMKDALAEGDTSLAENFTGTRNAKLDEMSLMLACDIQQLGKQMRLLSAIEYLKTKEAEGLVGEWRTLAKANKIVGAVHVIRTAIPVFDVSEAKAIVLNYLKLEQAA